MRKDAGFANFILPIACGDGEGDHAKHGGGVIAQACSSYPSTTLRVVPLPTASPQGGSLS